MYIRVSHVPCPCPSPCPRPCARISTNTAGCSFRGALLDGSRFNSADLSGADFSNAMIGDADFSGASIAGAVFTGVLGYDPLLFSAAVGVEMAIGLPSI